MLLVFSNRSENRMTVLLKLLRYLVYIGGELVILRF